MGIGGSCRLPVFCGLAGSFLSHSSLRPQNLRGKCTAEVFVGVWSHPYFHGCGILRVGLLVMLLGRVNNTPRSSRPLPKLILDPGQTSFGFEVPVKQKAPAADQSVAAPPGPPPPEALTKAPAAKRQRQRAVRARISFEAPMRLKRSLERAARVRDLSKTSILRAAIETYLRHPQPAEDEA